MTGIANRTDKTSRRMSLDFDLMFPGFAKNIY
jgi:hypothetical protein